MDKPLLPPAYQFLFDTHMPDGTLIRYKVPKGGRGKGATWNIGRRLIYKAHTQPSLIVCTREFQNSIADSVHRLLSEQIRMLGYDEFFDITENKIRSLVSDSEFIFRGLNDKTADTIRSLEGATDVWVAEAETMGLKAWQTLDPTVRREGSTIYCDYNPDDEHSATNNMFVHECPANALVKHLTYRDNPHFPAVLEQLRQNALDRIRNAPNDDAREQAQLDYDHVWEGATRKVNKASILGAHFMVEDFDPATMDGMEGPYDGADWGFSQDPTVRVRCWIRTMPNDRKRLYIEREAYGVAVELNDLPAMFDGTLKGHTQDWPNSRTTRIRADNARPETISHMKNAGFDITAADKWKGSVEDGIEHMRGNYDVIIVHTRCTYTAQEMKLYSYKVDKNTKDILADIIDKWNHCIDAIRYALDPVIKRKKGFFS